MINPSESEASPFTFACAYCERPLVCEDCQTPYRPPTQEHYLAMSQPEATLECPECEHVLVCKWCKTAYRGEDEE